MRKKLTAEQRKLSIIKATIRVVARLNYDRATIALIAKEAKINQALIYNHFKSKQALQLSMLDYIYVTLLDAYKSKVTNDQDELSVLQTITIQYHTSFNEDIEMWSCVLKAMVAIDESIREKAWEIVKDNHEFIFKYLDKDYSTKFKNSSLDIEMMSWLVFSSNLLFSSLFLMGKTDEIKKERIFKAVKDVEEIFLKVEG